MKRVLIVSYAYPPFAGVGIVKVLGTTRYLPEYGWEPTVLCVKPDGYCLTDPANGNEATPRVFVRRPPLAPFGIRVLDKLRLGARRGLLLPDSQIDWFLPACFAGRRELRRQRYDMIYATVPPYTSGLVGAYLSRWSGLPFVVDIRDPWLEPTFSYEYRTRLHRRIDLALERYVVRTAKKLTFIYQIGLDRYASRYPDRASDLTIIRPGFDFDRANGTKVMPLPKNVTL